ncbi:DUF6457 domain-containing protein [Amycolatopsis nigrescens]|uniref:DUF6457 domain-containing protein n=1 Tax=Amycolatopsis nigrescens TaxID=381445 RepID=UPI00036E326E|nr:DUF6457 domain-containing protein [Amycolatopsis nigrescens]
MDELAEWTRSVCAELEVPPAQLDPELVLNLARDVRRSVSRSAAPVTAFLFGLAVGRGLTATEAAERVNALVRGWRDIDWRD